MGEQGNSSLRLPRLSLSSPSPIFRLRFRLCRTLTLGERALTSWRMSGRRRDRECASAIDYSSTTSNDKLTSRMKGFFLRTTFEPSLLFVCCSLRVSIIATRPPRKHKVMRQHVIMLSHPLQTGASKAAILYLMVPIKQAYLTLRL